MDFKRRRLPRVSSGQESFQAIMTGSGKLREYAQRDGLTIGWGSEWDRLKASKRKTDLLERQAAEKNFEKKRNKGKVDTSLETSAISEPPETTTGG